MIETVSAGDQSEVALPSALGTAALFILAIGLGSTLGLSSPNAGSVAANWIDLTLLAMLFLLFFELRLRDVAKAFGSVRFLALAWSANFLLVPAIGFGIASLLVGSEPLLFAGLMLYLLAPCTDWFLGFTRMAQGDTELGAALIPINLLTQLLLFPLWLWLFTPGASFIDLSAMPGLIIEWFVVPFAFAQGLRFALSHLLAPPAFALAQSGASALLPVVLAGLIAQIFAGNVGAIAAELEVFVLIACAVALFFAATFLVGRALGTLFGLTYRQLALLAMTMAARNAPLMLALTAIALPDQPLILAVIVFGMLIEIPHLTLLKQLLLKRRATSGTKSPELAPTM